MNEKNRGKCPRLFSKESCNESIRLALPESESVASTKAPAPVVTSVATSSSAATAATIVRTAGRTRRARRTGRAGRAGFFSSAFAAVHGPAEVALI